ncbi:MAG: tetratricopeptide repeat protein [Deltaproteobacteria bacterium]|nr:tetratricopeptide repeat protein [Deltaproteobacteria bacterium]
MALKEKIIDRAQKFIQKGALDKALIEYKAASDVDPRDISIRLRIGDLYVKMNKRAEAIKEYTEVAKANSQRGFYLKAIAVYKQVLKLDESSLEVHYKLAELYTKQRLIADAIGSYSTIVNSFEKKGKTSEVMELLKKMIEIDPENIGVRLKLADLYQRLSFEKDALAEYSVIFYRLVAQGQFEKAERIYLNIYNSKPREPEVLKGLSDLYRKKGDDQQYLRFAKSLFYHYRDSGDVEAAKGVAASILEVHSSEGECLRFLKSLSRPEPREAPALKPAARETEEPLIEFPSVAAETVLPGPAPEEPEEKEAIPVQEEKPLISWPEEEIEISIEGFEEEAVPESKAAPAASAAPAKEEELGEIEIEVEEEPSAPVIETAPPEAEEGPKEPLSEPVSALETEIEAETEAGKEAAEPIESLEAVSAQPTEAEEAAPAGPLEEKAEEPPIVEFREEEAPTAKEEPIVEFKETEPVAGVEEAGAVTEEAAPEEKAQAPLIDIGEEEISERLKDEEAVPVVEIEATPEAEPRVEEAAGAEAVIEEERAAVEAIAEPPVEIEEEPAVAEPAPVEAVTEALPVEVVHKNEAVYEGPLEAAEEAGEETEAAYDAPADEDLSDAISELMEKIEGAEAESAPTAKIEVDEKVEAEEKIFPEVRFADSGGQITEESHPEGKDGYVDLSAELGMEEALEDLAGSWGGGGAEPKETFDEFKKGIGKQLSREDSETHYNLGIAYMEMELYNEAAKEFKIALKDPRLEFDCYIRLGLCSMADANPDEAIIYYIKGLKIEGKTDEERKGMMYELALAYEAAGDGEEATHLFKSIYETDPSFREVSAKVVGAAAPFVPLDDGLIEVELL